MSTTSGAPVARLDHVAIRFGRKRVVEGVSLAVAPGSVCALLGRNGEGKTSLLRCLLGQRRPAAGRARLFGADAWRGRARAMARVGVVPEEPDAPPDMTATVLSRYLSRMYSRWDSTAVAARLGRGGVPLDVPVGRLSRGQRGQLGLALALGHAPEVVVLDDPTLGLDVVARREVFGALIDELAARGTTVLLATHDLAGVEGLADRIAVLHGGRIVADEPTEVLKQRFRRLRLPAEAWDAGASPFAAAAIERRGATCHAVVTDFDEGRFAPLATRWDAVAEPIGLEDIFTVLVTHAGGAPVQEQPR